MHYKDFLQSNSSWGDQHVWNWNNFSCHWRVIGEEDKQPLVLIHGFGASSSHWRHNVDFFYQKGFCVYALDLIGFGESEQPTPQKLQKLDNHFWSLQLAAFLKEIIKTSANRKVILVGNSLGALTALTTAAFYPNLVKAVIAAPLADPTLIKSAKLTLPNWILSIKNTLIKILFKLIPLKILIALITRTKAINIAIQSAYYKSIKKDYELREIIIRPAQRKLASKALRAMCIGMSTRKENVTAPALLNRIYSMQYDLPILLIWGEEDKFVPVSIGKKLDQQYPSLELFIISNTGHCPHDESPSDFNHHLLHWLNKKLSKEI